MVELIAAHDGEAVLVRYLPQLEAEYAYWMDGAATLAPGSSFRHVVRLPDGVLLNRYWDDRAAPRDKSYREDVDTAARANRPAEEVYRDLRAGAEKGWDFSSRWLADGKTLSTIRTTAIAPVDLNALMVHLEQTLAKAYRLKGDGAAAGRLQAAADRRADAIRRLMWNAKAGVFADLLWREGRLSDTLSAATVAPLALWRRQSEGGPRGRRDAPRPTSRARRPRNDARRHRPAMGPPERLGSAAISGDQGSERLRRTGACTRDCAPLDRHQRPRLCSLGRPGREVRCRARATRGSGGRPRRRIRVAGRVRLDQWRAGRADGRISRSRSQGAREHALAMRTVSLQRSPDGVAQTAFAACGVPA